MKFERNVSKISGLWAALN